MMRSEEDKDEGRQEHSGEKIKMNWEEGFDQISKYNHPHPKSLWIKNILYDIKMHYNVYKNNNNVHIFFNSEPQKWS